MYTYIYVYFNACSAFVNMLFDIYCGPTNTVYNRYIHCLLCRVIYSSHPTANTIMLVGIIGCFLAVLCIGIDGRFVTPWQFLIICQARAWTMSIGFTLAFGAMFSKVWRVHRLSTKAKADQGKVSCKLVTSYYVKSLNWQSGTSRALQCNIAKCIAIYSKKILRAF